MLLELLIMTQERIPRYSIGQQFLPMGKKHTYTVVDYLITRNSKNEIYQIRYICTHLFCGQIVTDYDVPEATIARAKQIDMLEDA
jgi:hypothetical protein